MHATQAKRSLAPTFETMDIKRKTLKTAAFQTAILSLVLASAPVLAGTSIAPGDLALRHDIQVLADHGVITGPVSTWPLDWRAIERDLANADDVPGAAAASLARIRGHLERRNVGSTRFHAGISGAEKPTVIRGFQNTPRERAELAAGLSWHNDRLSIDLNVQGVDEPSDGKDVRADGSEIGLRLGNFTLAASTMERWWGPGWDGSLILSNNARPIPSVTLNRNDTRAFESKWLRWIGPWDFSLMFGQMESERVVPDAQLFGMRFNVRPLPSLEIGISRTAQWCGEGRPCDWDTFWNLLIGRDNRGGEGIDITNEPGNQLAGFDMRWSNTWFGTPMAIYWQAIGEDEAGGFPSRYLAMGGVEFSGWSEKRRWSYRAFAELAGTSCDFVKEDIWNCAYNHSIYQTGYRYYGRTVGHGLDNDALVGSAGLVLVTENEREFSVLVRSGDLNRGGSPDSRNPITPTPLELSSIDVGFAFSTEFGRFTLGAGYERLDDPLSGQQSSEGRGFLQWRSSSF